MPRATFLVDFASGGLDRRDPRVLERVRRQLLDSPLSTRHLISAPLGLLVERLAEICPGDLEISYPCNSADEAVEGALKLAKGYHPDRSDFVTVAGAYHGATLGALSVAGRGQLTNQFATLPLNCSVIAGRTEHDLVREARRAVGAGTIAVLVEPWPPGVAVKTPGRWLRDLREVCAASGALLIVDETRVPIGSTGRIAACEHWSVVPDVLVLGELLGAGVLPIAAYVTARAVNDRVYGGRDPTLHAGATAGNPAACVAALAAIEVLLEDGLVARAAELGRAFHQRLAGFADVTGAGLWARLRCADPRAAASLVDRCRGAGLLVAQDRAPGASTLDLRPPLSVDPDALARGLAALEAAYVEELATDA